MKKFITTIFILIFSSGPVFAADKVAKVLLLKGQVLALDGGKKRHLKKGDWVGVGAKIKTKKRSFVKFIMMDKSQMSIGPDSFLVIKSFPKDKAGIINLMKGKMRAQVTKNYMEINKSKSKLFIKTKTAAMGVRGTDFQVFYNPSNEQTSLVTFEGAVAMAKIDQNIRDAGVDQNFLEAQVSSKSAVMVRQGQFSGANTNYDRATIPVKMSPSQLEVMKENDGKTVGDKEASSTKRFRSPIPPGVDSRVFNSKGIVEGQVAAAVGKENAKAIISQVETRVKASQLNNPPPEGFYNSRTGAYAPPAGGLIDEKTALYVPPPKGSTFDSNSGVYIPPSTVGSFNHETGEYLPPQGYKLVDTGKFIPDEISRMPASAPASISGGAEMLPPAEILNLKRDATQQQIDDMANNFLTEAHEDYTNVPPPPLPEDFTRVRFVIEVAP